MPSTQTNIPRASVACTILDDTDFIDLCQSAAGREAVALFITLLSAAKSLRNGGVFSEARTVVAIFCRWPLDAFAASLSVLLNHKGKWVVEDGGTLKIRRWEKWNCWGGARDGSGAPTGNHNASKQSRFNQDSIKNNHSDSDTGINTPPPPPSGNSQPHPAPATPKAAAAEKPSKPKMATLAILERIGISQGKAEGLAKVAPARVLAAWAELKADPKVRRLAAVLPLRLAEAGPDPPLKPELVCKAIKAGLVRRLGAQAVDGQKATWNAAGVWLNGKLAVTADDLAKVDIG